MFLRRIEANLCAVREMAREDSLSSDGGTGKRSVGSPHFVLALVLAVWGGCAAWSVYTAMHQPWLGVEFTPASLSSRGIVVSRVTPDGPAAGVLAPGDVLVRVTASGRNSMFLYPALVVPDPDLLPRIHDWFLLQAELRRLNRLLAAPLVLFSTDTGRVLAVCPAKRRTFSSLPAGIFIILLSSLAALMIVFSIWTRRRASLPVRLLMLSGLGAAVASFASAVYSTRELALDAELFAVLAAINHVGAYTFIAGTVGLLWHYPSRIAAIPTARIVAAVLILAWLNERFAWIELLGHSYSIIGFFFFALALIFGAIQWVRTRGRPADRAALKWLFGSIFLITTIIVVVIYVPSLKGKPPILPMSASYVILLMMYVGCALAVFRYRLFDVERWWFTVWLWLLAGLSITAFDLAVSFFLPRISNYSLGIAVALVGWGYFPVRQLLWKRVLGRGDLSIETFLPHLAARVGAHGQDAALWGQVMSEVFRPVHMEAMDGGNDVRIVASGERMYVPAPISGGFELYHADHGSRLFTTADVELAGVVLHFCRSLGDHLSSYTRGVREERRRIMRDLHDEVGGRLLDIIHICPDNDELRQATSGTMGALREIIYCLDENEPVDLQLAMSRLRRMAGERCEAAGVKLDWPTSEISEGAILPRRVYYNLTLVCREVLTNAVRHGSGAIQVETEVDGVDISMKFANPVDECDKRGDSGFGADNIRARIIELDGVVESSCSDGVFTFNLRVPLAGGD